MMRNDVPKLKEQTIARFLGGLDNNISHMVELKTYCTFEDIYKLAIKVDKQKKSLKSSTPKNFYKGISYFWGFTSYFKFEFIHKDKGKKKSWKAPRRNPIL